MSSSQIHKFPYTKSLITELEVQYATDASADGKGEQYYDYTVHFDEAFKPT